MRAFHGLFLRYFSCALCGVLLCATSVVYALTVKHRTLPELIERADTIVVATVVGQRSDWNADGRVIYTFLTLTDLDVLKGDVSSATFELRMPGGAIGDQAQLYPGMPVIQQGERYILFIRGQFRDFSPWLASIRGYTA